MKYQGPAAPSRSKHNEPSRFLSDIPRELFGLPAAPAAAPSGGAEERLAGETYVEREPELELDEGDGFFAEEFDQRSEHERRSAPGERAALAAAPPPRPPRPAGGPAPAMSAPEFVQAEGRRVRTPRNA